jgi:hypothetical protein
MKFLSIFLVSIQLNGVHSFFTKLPVKRINLLLSKYDHAACYYILPSHCHTSYLDVKSFGLLSGLDCLTSNIYSTDVSNTDAAEVDGLVLYDEAKKDANSRNTGVDEYLSNLNSRAKDFAESDEIWDREKLKTVIKSILPNKGAFTCVLGGKDTGKSLVVESIAKSMRNESKVIYIDLRKNPDLLRNTINVLSPDNGVLAIIANMVKSVGLNWGWGSLSSLENFFDMSPLKNIPDIEKVEMLLNAAIASSKGCNVTVILDEANIAFQDKNSVFAASLLQLMTRKTKQKREVSSLSKQTRFCISVYNFILLYRISGWMKVTISILCLQVKYLPQRHIGY